MENKTQEPTTNIQPVTGNQTTTTTTNLVQQNQQPTAEDIARQQAEQELGALLAKALAYEKDRDYSDALKIYQQAQDLAIRTYGETHPNVAEGNIKIGLVYILDGDYDKAEPFLQRGLQAKIQRLGRLHPEIAENYIAIGNQVWEESEENAVNKYFKEGLDIIRTLTAEASKRNDTETAVPLYHRVFTIKEDALKELGIDVSIEFAEAQARLYLDRSDRFRAREAYERAFKFQQNKHGKEDPKVANWAEQVGTSFLERGFPVEAVFFLRRALEIYIEEEDEDHITCADTYHKLGYAYFLKELYNDAIEFYNTELKVRLKHLANKPDPSLAPVYLGLGQAYAGQGLYHQSIQAIQQCLGLAVTNQQDLIEPYRILGVAYAAKGLHEQAVDAMLQQQKLVASLKGENSLDLAPIFCKIGCVYLDRGIFDLAIKYHTAELELKVKNLAADDSAIADAHSHLGVDYLRRGAITEALQCFTKALEIRTKKFGKDSLNLIDDICNIGHAHKATGDCLNALNSYTQALDILSRSKTPTPLEVAKISNFIYSARQAWGNKNADLLKIHSSEAIEKFVVTPSDQLESFTIRDSTNANQSLFECIGYALDTENFNKIKREEYFASLRQLIAKVISEHAERFDLRRDFHNRAAQDYVNRVASENWWGSETDLKALSIHFKVDIVVYHIVSATKLVADVINGGVTANKKIVLFAYHDKNNVVTYDLLTATTKDKKEVAIFDASDKSVDTKVDPTQRVK